MKENVSPEILLEDLKPILEETVPRPETPRTTEDAQAVTDREARDELARYRVLLENEERRDRGPKVGHNVYYNEVQKRLASRSFLALGTEGKNDLSKRTHICKYLNWNFEKW